MPAGIDVGLTFFRIGKFKVNNMRFHWLFEIALAALVCYAETTIDDDATVRVYNVSSLDSICEDKGQIGVCVTPMVCKKPTGSTCKSDGIPMVCCLDKPKKTKRSNPAWRRRVNNGPIELTYPGCGKRPQLVGLPRTGKPTFPQAGYKPPMPGYGFGLSWGRKKRQMTYIPSDEEESPLGQRGGELKPVIAGGYESLPFSWPWMVAVFKKVGNGSRFICSASLISRYYILTAAHCFKTERIINPSKYLVIVGAHSTENGIKLGIRSVIVHPGYIKEENHNDIALLMLNVYVDLKYAQPICLPSEALVIPDGTYATVAGWGRTTPEGKSSTVLEEMTVPKLPLETCITSYGKRYSDRVPNGIGNDFICAGGTADGKDFCKGDSGGPIMVELEKNKWVQIGIVSVGSCAVSGTPGVHTRVSHYIPWISRFNIFAI